MWSKGVRNVLKLFRRSEVFRWEFLRSGNGRFKVFEMKCLIVHWALVFCI